VTFSPATVSRPALRRHLRAFAADAARAGPGAARTAGGSTPVRGRAVSAGQPHQPGDRRRLRPDEADLRRGGLRRGGDRGRPGRARGRGLRVLRRPTDRGGRARGRRKAAAAPAISNRSSWKTPLPGPGEASRPTPCSSSSARSRGQNGSARASHATSGGSSSPDLTCWTTVTPAGLSTARRYRWKRACPGSSRSVTRAADRSSGSPRRSARARSAFRWCTDG
jgi:hypothetical protein